MKIIADLHIHSKYSRAVSRDMTFENLDLWGRKKGINIIGTGDFTHPAWFSNIRTKLEPAEEGLYRLKSNDRNPKSETRFMLTAEIACIYSKKGRARRVHHVIFSPSTEAAEKINRKLSWIGNLKSDGRPMLGLDSKKLLEIILEADEKCVLVPAHAWTPWYSIFGSMSGFDSIEECFDDMSPYIFAIETGLSSDPPMNWKISSLNKISLVSNSDAHSPSKLGREANVFDCELSYGGVVSSIRSRDPGKFLYTIEFFPEEGKYHFDGHRACGVSFSPDKTREHSGLCPKCGRRLTVGVLNRVEELVNKQKEMPSPEPGRIPYKNLVPLNEIIAEAKGLGSQTKTVQTEYNKLIEKFGSEFFVLLDASVSEISGVSGSRVAEAVKRMREGKINIEPGYDGEFGKISLFREGEKVKEDNTQGTLF